MAYRSRREVVNDNRFGLIYKDVAAS